MAAVVVEWLDRIGKTAFTYSAWSFVLLNGFGIAMVALKRDRAMVNRWTSRFLAVNGLLLGTGLGVPIVTMAMRSAIVAIAPALHVRSSAAEARDSNGPNAGVDQGAVPLRP